MTFHGRRKCTISALAWCAAGLFPSIGCSLWDNTAGDSEALGTPANRLPASRGGPETLVIEVAILRVPGEEMALDGPLWRSADELSLPVDVRQQLYENGFRFGLYSSVVPDVVRELLPDATAATQVGPGPKTVVAHHRLTRRSGSISKIVFGDALSQAVLLRRDDQGYAAGKTVYDAQCRFALTGSVEGDGRATIRLTPQVIHGRQRTEFVPDAAGWQLNANQREESFADLEMVFPLTPGQTAIIGPTPDARGLGKVFFRGQSIERPMLLLVRLARTQLDGLFLPEALQKPLANDGR